MIRKEWKRMLALSMTYIMTLSVAAPVKAAEEELGVPISVVQQQKQQQKYRKPRNSLRQEQDTSYQRDIPMY